MIDFPLPGASPAVVAAPAPGSGEGWWAGGSSHELRTELISP